MALNLYASTAHNVSTPPAHDVSTCTAWLSADHRITFSSLFPPLSELVEVPSSVPVALVIKKGRIHTQGRRTHTECRTRAGSCPDLTVTSRSNYVTVIYARFWQISTCFFLTKRHLLIPKNTPKHLNTTPMAHYAPHLPQTRPPCGPDEYM